jgi:hypothetical protein
LKSNQQWIITKDAILGCLDLYNSKAFSRTSSL